MAERLAAGLIAKGLYMRVLSDSGRAFLTDSCSPISFLKHTIEIFSKSDCITVFNFDSRLVSRLELIL